MSWPVLSAMPGAAWPALPRSGGADVLALLFQLQQSERLPPDELAALQRSQLDLLLRHAYEHTPFYREHWGSLRPLEELPLLNRKHLQERFTDLHSRRYPKSHGPTSETRTSGSTGAPVRVLKSRLTSLIWRAGNLRDHAWHRRDLSGKLAVIRHGVKDPRPAASWGRATAGVVATGPAVALNIRTELGEQLDWLAAQAPQYLLTYPSNAAELARASLARGLRLPSLREVRTIGELLFDETRTLCREAWNAPVGDIYSADEVGYLAIQCPSGEHYHVQSESAVVEVLDEAGRPCGPGSIGKVVVTSLHNFAMPMIRYDIGDFAEVGDACACGRTLPVLKRVIGRVRNTLIAPDGKRYYPVFSMRTQTEVEKIRQYQFVQKAVNLIEVRLVTSSPLDEREEKAIETIILAKMPPGIGLRFAYPERLERSAGGKYEDFISEVAAAQPA